MATITLSAVRAQAVNEPLWSVAYLATLLMPLMLVFARTGAEICTAILGLSFLIHSARRRNWQWLRTPFSRVALAAWLWLVVVVTPLAVDPARGAIEAFFWFRLPLMVVAIRYWVLVDAGPRWFFYRWLSVFLLLVMVDTLWQLVTGVSLTGHPILESTRLTGPFTRPKVGYFMSKLILVPVAVLLFEVLRHRQRRYAIMLGVLLFAYITTVLLTGERAAFLAIMMATAAAAGLMMLVDKRIRLPGLLIGCTLIAGLAVLISVSDRMNGRLEEAIRKFDHFATSDYGLLFNAGIDLGIEYWPHGTGIRGFAVQSPLFELDGAPFRGLHPHNAYLEWFAEAGLPGMMLYAALAGTLFYAAWRQFRGSSGAARLVPAVAIGVLLQHFFPFMPMQSAFKNWSAMLVWFSVAITFAALPPAGDKRKT